MDSVNENILSNALQATNTLKQKELFLNNKHLFILNDKNILSNICNCFDIWNINHNFISFLGPFTINSRESNNTVFSRVSTILASYNSISNICFNIARALPNLKTIILNNNQIKTFDVLIPLSFCTKLERIDIRNNPIINTSITSNISTTNSINATVTKLFSTTSLKFIRNSYTDVSIDVNTCTYRTVIICLFCILKCQVFEKKDEPFYFIDLDIVLSRKHFKLKWINYQYIADKELIEAFLLLEYIYSNRTFSSEVSTVQEIPKITRRRKRDKEFNIELFSYENVIADTNEPGSTSKNGGREILHTVNASNSEFKEFSKEDNLTSIQKAEPIVSKEELIEELSKKLEDESITTEELLVIEQQITALLES